VQPLPPATRYGGPLVSVVCALCASRYPGIQPPAMARGGPPLTYRDLRGTGAVPNHWGSEERIEGGTIREFGAGRLEMITRDGPRVSEARERARIRERHPEYTDQEVEDEITRSAHTSRTTGNSRRSWAKPAPYSPPELCCRRCGARPRPNRLNLSRAIKVALDQGKERVYVSPWGEISLHV